MLGGSRSTPGHSRGHLGRLLVELCRALPGAVEQLRIICICRTLLQSSCRAFSLLPSCSRTGWAETGGSVYPSHATLLRGGERAQMKCWVYFHISAFPGKTKGPTLMWESPLGVVPPKPTRQRKAELVQPRGPKGGELPAFPRPLAPVYPNPS